jgi:acyl carrier protein
MAIPVAYGMEKRMSSETTATATEPLTLDRQATIDKFFAVVGEVIGIDEVPTDGHFLDVGGDSLSMAIIIDWLGQEFGVEPEVDWFFESQNLQELADAWWAKLEGGHGAAATA